jgi:hypothetical protein
MSRVAVLVAVAVAVLASGCSSSIGNPVDILPCTPSNHELDERMVLMAQSVPTASAVPCMRTLLDDWFLDDLDSWDGRTRILFSRLIDEFALTIELTRTATAARPPRPPPTSRGRGGSTSASAAGRPTATGGSTCCPVPA